MIFTSLSLELIAYILDLLGSTQDMTSIASTNQFFRYMCKKNGVIKDIVQSSGNDFLEFWIGCHRSDLSALHTIVIKKVVNPSAWLNIKWPKRVEILDCNARYIGPNEDDCSTSELVIVLNNFYSPLPVFVEINWNKFKNLLELFLRIGMTNLANFHNCKLLEKICIDFTISDCSLPTYFGDFYYLKILITNLVGDKPIKFISPLLDICVCPKKCDFTAVSTRISPRYLLKNDFR